MWPTASCTIRLKRRRMFQIHQDSEGRPISFNCVKFDCGVHGVYLEAMTRILICILVTDVGAMR